MVNSDELEMQGSWKYVSGDKLIVMEDAEYNVRRHSQWTTAKTIALQW